MRTGRLARPVEDYPEVVAYTLMFRTEEMVQVQSRMYEKQSETEWDRARSTGDEIADKWEKQLARGELPDWMKMKGESGG